MITAIDSKTALILIDLQKGIVGLPIVHPAETIVGKCAQLVTAFRSKNLPIVIVNVNPLGAKWTQTRVESASAPKGESAISQARIAMEQSGFFDIIPEIKTSKNDVFITKDSWNAFYNTALDESLKSLGITGIVLAGIATSVGVEGTARAAAERGYNISFAQDAMTDMHLTAHENSLQTIFPRLGEIDTTDAIIKMMMENGSENYK